MVWDGATFARWWADRYTRGLPAEVRDRRRAEIEDDVCEQTHAAATEGRAAGRAIAWRVARGVPADVVWRRSEQRAMRASHPSESRLRNTWAVVTQSWFAPIAVLIAVFDLLLAWGVATEPEGKMPGRAVGPVVMGLLGLALLGGLWLRWRTGRARRGLLAVGPSSEHRRVSSRRLGLAAAVLVASFALLTVGVSTGAVPVFFIAVALVGGTALVVGGAALARAVRSSDPADRSSLADGMIVVGTLPAFAFFWMVIPPLLAIAVLVGITGTGTRVRPVT